MHGQLWMTLLGMFPFSLFNFLPNQEAFLGTGNNGPFTSSFNTLPHQLHKWVQTIQKLWPIAICFCHCSLIDIFNSHIRIALNINKNFHHTVLFKLYKSISFNALIKITKSNLKSKCNKWCHCKNEFCLCLDNTSGTSDQGWAWNNTCEKHWELNKSM